MGGKAVVRGEVHVTYRDREGLLNRDLEEFQVLYCEGRGDVVKLHKYTICYMSFLIGYFTLEMIYIATSKIHELIPFLGYDMEDEARRKGLEFEDETDLEIHEIYENFSSRHIHGALALFAISFVVTVLYALRRESVELFWMTTPVPSWILPLTMGVLLPFAYSGILVGFANTDERDDTMAESIVEDAEENDYSGALVLVGDKHVEAVSDALEEQGWEVKRERSENWLARLSRFIGE